LRRRYPPAFSARRNASTGRWGSDGRTIDFRLTADGAPYFIEANPNPEIAKSQEFATAALHDGLEYPDLLHRILALGISRAKAGASVG
jgi:D-alanine-D-alanine ligase